MFSNPLHNLAVAALIAATLHYLVTICLISRNMLFPRTSCCLQLRLLSGGTILGDATRTECM